jgi:hypothetical protein
VDFFSIGFNPRPSHEVKDKNENSAKLKLEDVKKISSKLRFCSEDDIKKFEDGYAFVNIDLSMS